MNADTINIARAFAILNAISDKLTLSSIQFATLCGKLENVILTQNAVAAKLLDGGFPGTAARNIVRIGLLSPSIYDMVSSTLRETGANISAREINQKLNTIARIFGIYRAHNSVKFLLLDGAAAQYYDSLELAVKTKRLLGIAANPVQLDRVPESLLSCVIMISNEIRQEYIDNPLSTQIIYNKQDQYVSVYSGRNKVGHWSAAEMSHHLLDELLFHSLKLFCFLTDDLAASMHRDFWSQVNVDELFTSYQHHITNMNYPDHMLFKKMITVFGFKYFFDKIHHFIGRLDNSNKSTLFRVLKSINVNVTMIAPAWSFSKKPSQHIPEQANILEFLEQAVFMDLQSSQKLQMGQLAAGC